jgi:hypothetical protein
MKRLIVRIGLGIVMGGLLWGGLPANQATAALFQFNFTGTVTNVLGGPLTGSSIGSGTPFSASYEFETSPIPFDYNIGNTAVGLYQNELSNVKFSLGTYSNTPVATIVPLNEVHVRNGLADYYRVTAPVSGDPAGTTTLSPTTLHIDLLGGTGGITSDAFPITAPTVGLFTLPIFRVLFNGGLLNGGTTVIGNVSNITAVPLPPAVILFGAGLIALVSLGAGSWRKRNNSLA